MLSGCLAAVGSQAVELYAASGDLLAQHPNPLPSSSLGASSVGPNHAVICVVAEDGASVVFLDGSCSQRVLTSAELPAKPVALVGADQGPAPALAALLIDGSIAVFRLSGDYSSAAVSVLTAADVWGAAAATFESSGSVATRFAAATMSVDSGDFLLAAANRSQVALVAVTPSAASGVTSVMSVWSADEHIAAVAVGVSLGKPAIFTLNRKGVAAAQVANQQTGAAMGEKLVCHVLPEGVPGDVDAFVASDRGVIVSVNGGQRVIPLCVASNSMHKCERLVSPTGAGMIAVMWAPRGRRAVLLTEEGVITVPVVATAPAAGKAAALSSEAAPSSPLSASLIMAAPTNQLGPLRSAVEKRVNDARGLLCQCTATHVAEARNELGFLRACTFALMSREHMASAAIERKRSAIVRLDTQLRRLDIAAAVINVLCQLDSTELREAASVRSGHRDSAGQMFEVMTRELGLGSSAVPQSSRNWARNAYLEEAPIVAEVLCDALHAQMEPASKANSPPPGSLDAGAVIAAFVDAPQASADLAPLIAFYMVAAAPLQDRLALADVMGCSHALVHVGCVARHADELPTSTPELTRAARCVSAAVNIGPLTRSVITQSFAQLCDAASVSAVASLMSVMNDLHADRSRAGSGLPDRVLLRAILLSAFQNDRLNLPIFTAAMRCPDSRPVAVAALARVAAASKSSAIVETSVCNDAEVSLAVALLLPTTPAVAIQLLGAARRFDEALACAEQLVPADDQQRNINLAVIANLRSMTVKSTGPVSADPDDADVAAETAGSSCELVTSSAQAMSSALRVAPLLGVDADADDDGAADAQSTSWAAARNATSEPAENFCMIVQLATGRPCRQRLPCPYHGLPPVDDDAGVVA